MSNPSLLICDTDFLIQLFLTKAESRALLPLRNLKAEYGIQPAVVEQVYNELTWHTKFKDKFDQDTTKAVDANTLIVLEQKSLSAYITTGSASDTWRRIQDGGKLYSNVIDAGEAYTHAAGTILGVPAASHDFDAIKVLQDKRYPMPSPIVRHFDLISLAFRRNWLTIGDCDKIRQALVSQNEFVPRAFKGTSFEKGLPSFDSRLLDSSDGGSLGQGTASFGTPIVITKK